MASSLFLNLRTFLPAARSAMASRMISSRYGVGSSVGVSTTRCSRIACRVTAVIKALVDKPREAAKSAITFFVLLSVLMVKCCSTHYVAQNVLQLITNCNTLRVTVS